MRNPVEMNKILFPTFILSALLAAGGASAQGADVALDGWFEINSFHPASTPEDGLTLERGRVLRHLQLGVGGVFQFENDPLTWQREEDGGYTQTDVEVERLFAFHLGAALGLFEHAQLGIQMPLYLDKGRPTSPIGGVGDLRLAPKLAHRLALNGKELGLALYLPVAFPTGNANTFTGQGGVTFEPRLAAEIDWGRFFILLNLGALLKESREEHGFESGNEVFAGLGLGGALPRSNGDVELLLEATLASQTGDFMSRAGTVAVLTGGVRYVLSNGLSLGGAMGTGLSAGIGVPDFRALVSLGLAPTPFGSGGEQREEPASGDDRDGDSIPDHRDECPEVAEDFDGYQDEDGCEDRDNDGDGVPDKDDECPNDAETANGTNDADGCPELDGDEDGVADDDDRCPDRPEDRDGFEDADGCPELDNDFDDFDDDADECPMLPESASPRKRDGCPDTFSLEGDRLVLSRSFAFKRGRADLTRRDLEIVDDLSGAIIANAAWTEIRIVVRSNAGRSAGGDLSLSERRAMAVLRALVERGVNPERLAAGGEDVGDEEDETVEITVVKGGDE